MTSETILGSSLSPGGSTWDEDLALRHERASYIVEQFLNDYSLGHVLYEDMIKTCQKALQKLFPDGKTYLGDLVQRAAKITPIKRKRSAARIDAPWIKRLAIKLLKVSRAHGFVVDQTKATIEGKSAFLDVEKAFAQSGIEVRATSIESWYRNQKRIK